MLALKEINLLIIIFIFILGVLKFIIVYSYVGLFALNELGIRKIFFKYFPWVLGIKNLKTNFMPSIFIFLDVLVKCDPFGLRLYVS